MTIEEVIAALEAATEPSEELDEEIALLLGWTRVTEQPWYWLSPDRSTVECFGRPAYTASVDKALRLVPKGWRIGYMGEWDAEVLRAKGPWQIILVRPGESFSFVKPNLSPRCDHAPTLPLAICIAALEARQHEL